MKSTLVLISLTLAASLCAPNMSQASPGTAAELVFPVGSMSVSGSSQSVAISESYIVVGLPSASYSPKAGVAVVNAAGEVQVFSTATGKFIRRLRSPKPAASGLFGGLVTVSGTRAYILENERFIHAYELSTGARVWTNSLLGENPPLKYQEIRSLAVDGDTLLAGMPLAWTVELPNFNQFSFQGLVRSVSCKDGKNTGTYLPAIGQAFCDYGLALAISGDLMVFASPRREVSGKTDGGQITVRNRATVVDIVPADLADGDQFGSAVAISRDLIFVGSPKADVNGRTDVGAVYVYDAKNHHLVKKLTAPTSLPNGCTFGSSLSATGTLVVVGASGGLTSGSVWLYDTESESLVQMLPSALGKTSRFGTSLGIFGSHAVICDPIAVGGSSSSGRVHRVTQLGRDWGDANVLASTKTAAPGLSGPVYAAFGDTAMSVSGKALHTATLSGPGVTTANNTGLWNTSSGSLDLVVREGDLYSAQKLQSPTKTIFTQSTTGLFQARYVGKTQANLFVDTGSMVYRALGEGDFAPVNGIPEQISRL